MGYLPKAYRISDNKVLFVGNELYIMYQDTRRFVPVKMEGTDRYSAIDMAFQNDDFVLLKNGNRAFKLDIRTHESKKLFEIPENENITSMSYDGVKIVWIGTSAGLWYIELQKPVYSPLRSNHFFVCELPAYQQGPSSLDLCAQYAVFI